MGKQKYRNSPSVERLNGTQAMNATGRALADKRSTATAESRIQRKLGTDDTFTPEFKQAFDPGTEHLGILERVYLLKELDAARKIITAIKKHPADAEAQNILKKMQSIPTNRTRPCVHCPIWRHEHELRMIAAAMSRYVFPRVAEQLYLVTIVFDFSENLHQLEDAIQSAHDGLKAAVTHMTRHRYGVMMTGALEPDLKSFNDLITEPKSISMMRDFGIAPTEAGGWTLTGHFFVRVPHVDELADKLRQLYPCSSDWIRVQFKKIQKDRDLLDHLIKILGYAGKSPQPLFAPPTRDTKKKSRKKANELMRRMSSAFQGAQLPTSIDSDSFDLDAAIVQWVKFTDRMGAGRMYYSVESAHAQKWYSESETAYVRMTDIDLKGDGQHLIEVHRDCGPFSPNQVMPHLKGQVRSFRSRPLKYDADWIKMTNCEGINPDRHYHDFDEWTLRPGV